MFKRSSPKILHFKHQFEESLIVVSREGVYYEIYDNQRKRQQKKKKKKEEKKNKKKRKKKEKRKS